MVYAIGILAAAGSFLLARIALNLERVRASKWLTPRGAEGTGPGKQLSAAHIQILSALTAAGAAVSMWRMTAVVHTPLNAARLAAALVLLTGGACVDYIEHRIPNIFPGTLAVLAVTLLLAAYTTGDGSASAYITSSVFAAAVCALCLTVGSVLSHQGIGMGDIKLLTALALCSATGFLRNPDRINEKK